MGSRGCLPTTVDDSIVVPAGPPEQRPTVNPSGWPTHDGYESESTKSASASGGPWFCCLLTDSVWLEECPSPLPATGCFKSAPQVTWDY